MRRPHRAAHKTADANQQLSCQTQTTERVKTEIAMFECTLNKFLHISTLAVSHTPTSPRCLPRIWYTTGFLNLKFNLIRVCTPASQLRTLSEAGPPVRVSALCTESEKLLNRNWCKLVRIQVLQWTIEVIKFWRHCMCTPTSVYIFLVFCCIWQ